MLCWQDVKKITEQPADPIDAVVNQATRLTMAFQAKSSFLVRELDREIDSLMGIATAVLARHGIKSRQDHPNQ
ncbi:MAG TPA: hypothetical protein VMU07_02010 [Candidatus Paceibacterota bacterium]|nr:hypothetical protein [Candidatus Paceibacterota bacterium]